MGALQGLFVSLVKLPTPTRNDNPWRYAFLGTQLAVSVLAGCLAGYWFDRWRLTAPWGLVVGAGAGFAVGLYQFLAETRSLRGG
jgi:F0F1-type ATP synthase assembly protein I